MIFNIMGLVDNKSEKNNIRMKSFNINHYISAINVDNNVVLSLKYNELALNENTLSKCIFNNNSIISY